MAQIKIIHNIKSESVYHTGLLVILCLFNGTDERLTFAKTAHQEEDFSYYFFYDAPSGGDRIVYIAEAWIFRYPDFKNGNNFLMVVSPKGTCF
jgi:hypothetical protein